MVKNEFQSLTEYTKMLESTNQEIRSFRHDYKNILLTIENYLDDRSYEELNEFFRTVILPTVDELDKDTFKISKVSNIDQRELKSIIVNKILIAQQRGIDAYVEVPTPLKSIPAKTTGEDFSILNFFNIKNTFFWLLTHKFSQKSVNKNIRDG